MGFEPTCGGFANLCLASWLPHRRCLISRVNSPSEAQSVSAVCLESPCGVKTHGPRRMHRPAHHAMNPVRVTPDSHEPRILQAPPGRVELPTFGLGKRRSSEQARGVMGDSDPFVTQSLARDLLLAVAGGHPAGDIARELALAMLALEAPHTALWLRAVAVLEGGPTRMRDAVHLAGDVLAMAPTALHVAR